MKSRKPSRKKCANVKLKRDIHVLLQRATLRKMMIQEISVSASVLQSHPFILKGETRICSNYYQCAFNCLFMGKDSQMR